MVPHAVKKRRELVRQKREADSSDDEAGGTFRLPPPAPVGGGGAGPGPAAVAPAGLTASATRVFGYGKAPVAMTHQHAAGPQLPGQSGVQVDHASAYLDEGQDPQLQQLMSAAERQSGLKGVRVVDISAKATVGTFEEWRKQHGHEQATSMPKSHTYTASSAGKRKHQLSWLATQAKERQHELESAWAAGSQAKRAAKQRYGF